MRKRLRYVVFWAGLMLVLPAVRLWAQEAFTGVYFFNGSKVEFVVKNESAARINVHMTNAHPEDAGFYLLFADGVTWAVGADADGLNAIRYEDAREFLGAADAAGPPFTVKAANIDVNIAGMQGMLYNVTGPPNVASYTAVLTEDAGLAHLSWAVLFFCYDFVSAELAVALSDFAAFYGKTYGFLQLNNDFELKSFAAKDYPDDYFELPPGVKILKP